MAQTLLTEASPSPSVSLSHDHINTIDELIKRRAEELQESPLLGYPKEGVADYEEHSARAVDRYADAAARKLQELGLHSVPSNLEKAPVVAMLAQSGLHIIITIIALSRLGYAVLLLSTRLPSPAIRRLLHLSDCSKVLSTETFHTVLAEIQTERQLDVLPLLAPSDYYGVDAPVFHRAYDPVKESQKIAIIIHSSGSTGLPKPIWLTHSNCIASFATNLNMRALITSPLFHSHGFYETFRSIYSGKPIYYCNYALPLTKQSLTAMLDNAKPDLFHSVPYVLKLLSESDEGVRELARVKLVLYAGSACPDDLGDRLVQNGVYLVGNYGATETGRLMNSVRASGDLAWNYLRLLPSAEPFVLMDKIAPGLHECVALDGLKSKSTINSDDPPNSFRTRDLFAPHPTRPGLWKYVSRLDDRFTLINGEKVLPIPIEGRIRQEPFVQEACVFGDGKSIPGVLIIKDTRASSTSDDEFLQMVWPAVESANSRAETFSRIPKELVVILPSNTTYPRTDKGTFIRAQMYSQFRRVIDAAYENFEVDEGGNITLEEPELQAYLLQRFQERLGIDLVSAETDFFASGIDSLQCIKMWNTIKKELDLGGRHSRLSQNVLYETGNVRALAHHLYGLRMGKLDDPKNDRQIMEDLIAKYSSFTKFLQQPNAPIPETEVVLLTGATGGLGAHLLAQLVARPNVSQVWTLVRASSESTAVERVLQSLQARGLHLHEEEKQKVIALPSDLSQAGFGLDPSKLSEVQSKLTLVIHSAWAVNFNLSVQSFEDQHIKAVHNLIQLCQSSTLPAPARFFYCSSVSAAGGTPRPGIVKEAPVTDISHVQGTGYAQSKYVAEHITVNAMKDAGAHARVLRVGQLAGDTKAGEWNATEGIPLMIQTAVTIGALPALDEEMSWLPVDTAASIILDLVGINNEAPDQAFHRETDANLVYHVLNPTRFHWSRDMLPALADAGLKFETLPTGEWMQRLRASDRDPKRNPPIKLLDWFESKYSRDALARKKGEIVYLTEETAKDSQTLGEVPDVTDRKLVAKMVEKLRRHWANGEHA